MVMVKAGAYGSGSVEVARLLEFQHADCLCVAYADEGVTLRKAGIRLPIVVMNPEAATFDVLLSYDLEPEIYSLRLLRSFLAFIYAQPDSRRPGRQGDHSRQALHLKLETGMHRLGFETEDIPEAVSLLAPCQDTVRVHSVFSHLAASEDPAHDTFTLGQIRRFQDMYQQLATGLGYRPLRHILNTSGIIRFPTYHMEMVRLGLGLYGIDSTGQVQPRLQTVNTLKATISQIKRLNAGDTVGYGRRGMANGTLRIATISIGYADGLQRKAGNGRCSVLINGQRAPIIGSICMDMTMVDITHIPDAKEGDSVIVFGKDLPVQELADKLDTIPYEIFTAVSDRVKRIYIQD
jgi:alanine racemase